MNGVAPDLKLIFSQAVEIESPTERAAYLDEACGRDSPLRSEVERLLLAAEQAGSFMDGPAVARDDTQLIPNVSEGPGTTIGPYKLLQQIGEGGMGVVFMAEQSEPIQRTVALKVIKPGMDTRQVIARFEAERQALAMMDHPNIARVIDAGTTETGRPYFVMELVKGVPITKYCDDKRLSLRKRLELFKPVCEAVQHAHQKGVIHRDLKPTNVLVAEYDNRAVPKVIDFGVAKATAQKLTERTMFTEFGQVIGTVEYMSPEQAKFNQLDIDTRSDIYSLGVLLYELLTGSTPFDRVRLREAAFEEVLRIIREEDPPKPSTRLSSLMTSSLAGRDEEVVPSSLASIAANRHTEPARLSKDVSGELDWIVMKCLEKDRNRRYETANGLGRDIERYLKDEPVQACPPSAAYRFRKFARRNKVAMFVASVAIAVSVLGVAGLAISNRLISAQRQRAESNFVRSRLAVSKILSQAAMGTGDWAKLTPELRKKFANEAIAFYDSFLQEETADPALQYETAVAYRALSELYRSSQEMEPAEKFVRQSLGILDQLKSQYPKKFEYRHELAYGHYTLGQLLRQTKRASQAEPQFKEAAALYEKLIAERPDVAEYFNDLGRCYRASIELGTSRGPSNEAEQTIQRLIDLSSIAPPGTASAHANIGFCLDQMSRYKEAAAAYRKAIEIDPKNSNYPMGLGLTLYNQRKYDESEAAFRKAIEIDPKNAGAYNTLGVVLVNQHKYDEAVAALRKAIEIDPKNTKAYSNLGVDLDYQHKYDEAAAAYRKAIELDPKYSTAYINLGILFRKQGRLDDAVEAYRKAIELAPDAPGPYFDVGNTLTKQGKLEEAVAAYRKTIDLKPRYNAYIALGDVLLKQGKRNDALAAYRKAVELQPDMASDISDASDWFGLAIAHWHLGNTNDARTWFAKAAEWMEKNLPDDPEIRESRAEAAKVLGITEPKLPIDKPPAATEKPTSKNPTPNSNPKPPSTLNPKP